MIEIRFKLDAEAQRLIAKTGRSVASYDEVIDRIVGGVAKEAVTRVKSSIEGQSFENAQINPKWMAYKRRHGLDTRTLIASQEYLKGFKAVRISKGRWAISIDNGPLHENLESNRPHVGPVVDRMESTFVNEFAKRILREIFG